MNIFTTYIYQPFFNILVGIYWLLSQLGPGFADMGIAVIIFALIVRLITFPLTLLASRSEEEKRRIMQKLKEIEEKFSHSPIQKKKAKKQIFRSNKRVVISTTTNLLIQFIVILMLYRIFKTGLVGKDFHLLYDFMPEVQSVNLLFMDKYDLTHTNMILNFIQSGMIFVVELLSAIRSPFPLTRKRIVLNQIVLPAGSYFAFMFLPAGKKVYIIASLTFSALYSVVRIILSWVERLNQKLSQPPKPQEEEPENPPNQNPIPTPAQTPQN